MEFINQSLRAPVHIFFLTNSFCAECLDSRQKPSNMDSSTDEYSRSVMCPICERNFDCNCCINPTASNNEDEESVLNFGDNDDNSSSVKLSALLQDLMRVRDDQPDVKSIVFSQWYIFRILIVQDFHATNC